MGRGRLYLGKGRRRVPHTSSKQDPHLQVPCPQCGGPLHLVMKAVECEEGHGFTVESAMTEQAQIVARAIWQAIHALSERAAMSRWAAEHPDIYQHRRAQDLAQSAASDDAMADVLRGVARGLS